MFIVVFVKPVVCNNVFCGGHLVMRLLHVTGAEYTHGCCMTTQSDGVSFAFVQ